MKRPQLSSVSVATAQEAVGKVKVRRQPVNSCLRQEEMRKPEQKEILKPKGLASFENSYLKIKKEERNA